MQQLCDIQAEPCAIKDLEHRFIHANPAFCLFVGKSLETLVGSDDLEIGLAEELVLGNPDTGWPGFWAMDDKAVANGKSLSASDDFNAYEYLSETIRTPLQNEAGETVALMVQLRDLSEVQKLEQKYARKAYDLQHREGEIMTLDSVLTSLLDCEDTITLLTQLANILVERTSADGAYMAVLHESGDFMECVAGSGDRVEEFLDHKFHKGRGIVGYVWELGHAEFLDDINVRNPVHKYPAGTQVFAQPMYVKDKAVATLMVISDPESLDLAPDREQLERICSLASIALTNTQQLESTNRNLNRSRSLAAFSEALNQCDETISSYDTVCEMALDALDAKRCTVWLLNDCDRLNPTFSWAQSDTGIVRIPKEERKLIPRALPDWTVENDQIGLLKRLEEDTRESTEVLAQSKKLNLGSTCCAPLKAQGRVIGAMSVTRDQSQRDFDDDDINVLETIVNQLSTVIERTTLSKELQHQAFHDALTQLPNRHSFEQVLESNIADVSSTNSTFSILFIDLDGFKDVNDSLGHAAGDKLLKDTSERFNSCLGEHDVLARMGGDEFAAVTHGDGNALAAALLESLNEAYVLDTELVNVGGSIGISRYPEHGDTVDSLLRSADVAMYQAKRSGKGCVFNFDESLASESRERLALEQDLASAIENQEFYLLYQPQVRCSDSKVVGLEALIRWDHPQRGVVSPNDFIPIAEANGMIKEIGAWVMDEAIRQLAEWHRGTTNELRVCINVAACQFELDSFCDQVLDSLMFHDAPAHLLELEVTESAVMHDISGVVARLETLRAAGIRIAIDDFGTGYSSLSYLQDLPLDVLKIDRTFINRLTSSVDESSLVNTILLLASGLGLETIAEGVEILEQRDQIASLGCDIIQGFLYSKPVPACEIPAAIAKIESRLSSKIELRRAA